jgi:5-methyltetrahydropteroyltriglutamate--homocysteine methyltransferase
MRPFRDAMSDARYREQYTDAVGTCLRDQERAGLDIVTDGDARFDTDVGGMSWFQYPARRFKGLAGADYYRAPKGYGGTAKGDILFEVMESRVLPRCVGKIERGPLQSTYLWKVAQGMSARPVKFGTITPELIGTSVANEHSPSHRELLADIGDAMNQELTELARAGCAVIQMEEPNIHLAGVQRQGAWGSSTRSSSWRSSTARSGACATSPRCGATPAGATRPSSVSSPLTSPTGTPSRISTGWTSTSSPSSAAPATGWAWS